MCIVEHTSQKQANQFTQLKSRAWTNDRVVAKIDSSLRAVDNQNGEPQRSIMKIFKGDIVMCVNTIYSQN